MDSDAAFLWAASGAFVGLQWCGGQRCRLLRPDVRSTPADLGSAISWMPASMVVVSAFGRLSSRPRQIFQVVVCFAAQWWKVSGAAATGFGLLGFGGFFLWFSGGCLAAAVEATVRPEVGWQLCCSGQQQGPVPRVAVVSGMRLSNDGAVRVVVDCLGCLGFGPFRGASAIWVFLIGFLPIEVLGLGLGR